LPAITATLLTSSATGTDATLYTTVSVTPTGNRLNLGCIFSDGGGGDVPTVSGFGLTWVAVSAVNADAGNSEMFLFRALGASPTAGTITISYPATKNGCAWSFLQFADVNTGGTDGSLAVQNVSTAKTDGNTGLTVTLDAFQTTNNATFGCFGHNANEGTSPGAGFTEKSDVGHGVPNQALATEFRDDNDTTVSATWAGNVPAVAIAVELVRATSLAMRKTLSDLGTRTASRQVVRA